MLTEVYHAAREVMNNAKSTRHAGGPVDEKDAPRARRRCVLCLRACSWVLCVCV